MTIFSHTFSFFLSFCTKNNIYFPALFLYNHNHTCEKQKNKREGCGIQKNPAKKTMKDLIKKWNKHQPNQNGSSCGLIIGLVLGLVVPQASVISILGTMFVGALKGIAPLLVFFLVMSALCHMKSGQKTNLKFIIILYMVGNLVSAFVAVIACRLFPVTLTFTDTASATDITPPSGIAEVLTNLLNNLVKNPVDSIVNANYIGILFWAVIFGIALKHANKGTKRCTGEHFRCNGDRSAVDHQLCSVRYHGSDLLYDLRTGTGCITFLWKVNPRSGWKYGCCYLHYQSGHCIYFHKTEPISTGIYLSERELYHSILHQKFCCQYSG